jgi:ElaB/YqjD/DUF883 family membrane-anchored ribosome-binding protein
VGEEASKVRQEIALERAELGETVKALAEKADVKGRVQKKAAESVEQAQQKAGDVVDQVHQKAGEIRSATPEPIVSGVHTATTTVRRRPVPAAAVIIVAVALILCWLLRRRG